MSQRIKAWFRRSISSSSSHDENDDNNELIDSSLDMNGNCFNLSNVPTCIIQHFISFLTNKDHHQIRLVCKDWNNLCNLTQKTLHLSHSTPIMNIQYWMLQLVNVENIILSHNGNIDDQFLLWLHRQYLPHKIKLRKRINLYIDLSFCIGIDCVEVPQPMHGRGGVNGYNSYLTNLMNEYTPFGVQFNIFGNYRVINPSPSLPAKHVVLLQLYALKYNEIQHCFKFASTANRQFTGPLTRFESIIKHHYPIMIGWTHINIYDTKPSDNDHGINGKQSFQVGIYKKDDFKKFKWTVTLQDLEHSAWNNCWMTDSVSTH